MYGIYGLKERTADSLSEVLFKQASWKMAMGRVGFRRSLHSGGHPVEGKTPVSTPYMIMIIIIACGVLYIPCNDTIPTGLWGRFL